MDIFFITKGILIGIAVSIPVGPVAVLCIQRTLNKGFRSGFTSSVGAAFADVLYAAIAGFSITFVANLLNDYQSYIRIFGGMFLIFIGVRIFFSNPATQMRKYRQKGNNYFKDFFSSFLITISNPITIVAIGIIFANFDMIPNGSTDFSIFVLILSVFSGALLWWLSLVSIISVFKKRIRLRNILWINRITGVFIVLFAIYIILTVFIPEATEFAPSVSTKIINH